MIRVSKPGAMAAVSALALTLSPVSPASATPCAQHAAVRHQINSLRDELRDLVVSRHTASHGNHGRRGTLVAGTASHGRHGRPGSQMRKVQKFVRTVRKQIAC